MYYSEPEFIDITPEQRARLEKFREDHADDELGNVATSILFEDDNVRIWEMTLEPGESSDLHYHAHDYYLLIFSGDIVAGIPPKDSDVDLFIGKIPSQGNTVPIPKGGTEWAYNIGQQTYREILVELKNT
jgi:mannose-6-phosphate isomerase-like protein (cupin superfamily)